MLIKSGKRVERSAFPDVRTAGKGNKKRIVICFQFFQASTALPVEPDVSPIIKTDLLFAYGMICAEQVCLLL